MATEGQGGTADLQLCPLSRGPFAEKIEVALNPFTLEIAQGTDTQTYGVDPLHSIDFGVFENDAEDASGHGKLMHATLR